MFEQNDDLTFSPFSCNPIEPLYSPTINDPIFNHIYDFLRDPSKTTFDFPPAWNTSDVFVNDNTSDVFVNDDISDVFVNGNTSNHYQQSETVYPICTIPNFNKSQQEIQQPCEQQPTVQIDGSKSKQIKIKTNPRSKFRPRTEKESQGSAHYIRSEDYVQPGYPSIEIEQSWGKNNIIEVTLVDKDKQPHPYTLESKERKTSQLIFKENEPNSLYFHVTKEDYENKEKIFLMEYIKPKQDDDITKELIKTRQLHKSILRFTRFYQTPDGSYQRDESSTAYSCLMTEDYGAFTIEDVFPLYGPMSGNQKVCVELKGTIPKDFKNDLKIILTGDCINWSYEIENIKKNRNNITFLMPTFPYSQITRAKINILIQYKQKIHQVSYIYTRKLDEELVSTIPQSNTSGALPAYSSTDIQNRKRARQ